VLGAWRQRKSGAGKRRRAAIKISDGKYDVVNWATAAHTGFLLLNIDVSADVVIIQEFENHC
jgi:hypothetical protein